MTRGMGADAAGWTRNLDEVLKRIAGRLGRAEPRRRAEAYLRDLPAPVECKNGWQLAEAAGDATPDGVQEFLSRVRWNADAGRDDLQASVTEYLGNLSVMRSYPGWHRHVTLALLAYAYLAGLRRAAIGGRGHGRPRRGSAATDRARDPASVGRPRRPASARQRRGSTLVRPATAPPAAGQARPLATADPSGQTIHHEA